MVYPLSWLSEYVKLPKTTQELTDKLTMIGHLLDKKEKVGTEEIVDLELRGNRPDLLGIYGMAREISATWNTPLKSLVTVKLPKTDPDSKLVTVKAPELLERFVALTLSVEVKPSPVWLKERLSYFGIPSVNNVVDITNYVMLETGQPMHCFDLDTLTGKRLILRRARQGESLTTLNGTNVALSNDDLVIADLTKPQTLTIIGGRNSATTFKTKQILIEAAVYKYANVRHTARRLGIRTEAGIRQEKILDPNQVPIALERALKLLIDLAKAKTLGEISDFYPDSVVAKNISINQSEVKNLVGLDLTLSEIEKILVSLECQVKSDKNQLLVKPPTFRTDIIQTADLVEEVARIYGYEHVPTTLLPEQGDLPINPYPKVNFEEKIRDALVNLGYNEIISSSLIANESLIKSSKNVKIINPPDVNQATLRPNLLLGITACVRKASDFKQKNKYFFEIGKVFLQDKNGAPQEETHVAFIGPLTQELDQKDFEFASGYVSAMLFDLEIDFTLSMADTNPHLSSAAQCNILNANKENVGQLGFLNQSVISSLKLPQNFFYCELNVEQLVLSPKKALTPYYLYASFPPLYEDITFKVPKGAQVGSFIDSSKKISFLLKKVSLKDTYGDFWTLNFTYQDPKKSLSTELVKPIREKIIRLAKEKFNFEVRE